MFSNNLTRLQAAVQRLQDYNQNSIYVILSGPFTKSQRDLAKHRTEVDLQEIREAMTWLQNHNPHYKDFAVPPLEDIATPIIFDQTEEVASVPR